MSNVVGELNKAIKRVEEEKWGEVNEELNSEEKLLGALIAQMERLDKISFPTGLERAGGER